MSLLFQFLNNEICLKYWQKQCMTASSYKCFEKQYNSHKSRLLAFYCNKSHFQAVTLWPWIDSWHLFVARPLKGVTGSHGSLPPGKQYWTREYFGKHVCVCICVCVQTYSFANLWIRLKENYLNISTHFIFVFVVFPDTIGGTWHRKEENYRYMIDPSFFNTFLQFHFFNFISSIHFFNTWQCFVSVAFTFTL